MRWFVLSAACFLTLFVALNIGLAQVAKEPAKTPADVTATEPDEHGLVTMARPLLSHVAAGDPLRVAVHFATAEGPIQHHNEKFGRAMIERATSLKSFEVAVRAPGGKWQLLKPEDKASDPINVTLVAAPTFLLELRPDGLALLNEAGEDELALPWSWGEMIAPGKLEVAVRGKLFVNSPARKVTKDGVTEDIPASKHEISFRSKPVVIDVARADMTNQSLAELQEAAIKALTEKVKGNGEELTIGRLESIPIADEAGNRVIRVRASIPMPKPMEGVFVPMIAGGMGYWQYEVVMSPAGKVVSYGRARKGFCVAKGTSVATPDGDRPIEALRPGMLVWAFDAATQKSVATEVQAVQSSQASETILFNGALRLTAEHPVFVRTHDAKEFAWKLASAVQVGDELRSRSGRPVKVEKVEVLVEEVEVFDVAVAGPHNFFAADLLVHNKSIAWTPEFFVPWYSMWKRAPAEKAE